MNIERHTDATRINAILNDPIVRPDVADGGEVLDISQAVANPANYLLMGEHGGMMFFRTVPGFYEVHTQVLSEGRGEWGREFMKSCLSWMFERTDAIEILTRVPHGHVAAKAATLAVGARYRWSRPNNCVFRGHTVDVDIYSLTIQDWVLKSDTFEAEGALFHIKLHAFAHEQKINGETHPDDPNHNRFVGACLAIMKGGQIHKSVSLYNLWAVSSRHRPVALLSLDPVRVRFDIGILALRDGEVAIEAEPPS